MSTKDRKQSTTIGDSNSLCDLMHNQLFNLCREYEIQPKMAKYFKELSKFKIVLICDDSGSMSTLVTNTQRTRWDELCSIVKIIVKIAVIFDSNGIDIHFLNRRPVFKVKDPGTVEQIFQVPPGGYTPLVPVLKNIFESSAVHAERDQKLLVFVATDGEPTDDNDNANVPELEHFMREKREVDTTYVSFLLCTDDLESTGYMDEWDITMKHVDVTSTFLIERSKIHKCRGQIDYSFSLGDYIVKALVGSIVPKTNLFNDQN